MGEKINHKLRICEFAGSQPQRSGKDYQWSRWADGAFARSERLGRGSRLLQGWTIPRVVRALNRRQKPKLMPDFVYHSGGATQLISRRALDVLCDLISSDVELLPVDADFGDYAAINVLTEIKAIDEELSTGSRSSSGRIFVVEDHVFDPVPILRSGAMVFRDASRTVPAYCRHEVIERAWEHKLTGFVDPRKWLWESVKPIV